MSYDTNVDINVFHPLLNTHQIYMFNPIKQQRSRTLPPTNEHMANNFTCQTENFATHNHRNVA